MGGGGSVNVSGHRRRAHAGMFGCGSGSTELCLLVTDWLQKLIVETGFKETAERNRKKREKREKRENEGVFQRGECIFMTMSTQEIWMGVTALTNTCSVIPNTST